MEYQEGDYLFHEEYGIGKILRVAPGEPADLTVDFERSPNFTMSAPLAERTTQRLMTEGFKALAYEDHTEALRLIKEEPAHVVALVLRDFPNQRAKQEEIKDYLARYVKDWPEWWKHTQTALKDVQYIDTSKSKLREYGLRETQLSRVDEAFDRFQRLQRNLARPEEKTTPDDVYRQACQVLRLVQDGASISDRPRGILLKYFREVVDDVTRTTEQRLDAVFRLIEVGWLTQVEGRALIDPFNASDLKLYRLGVFSQNRLLDLLLSTTPSAAELRLLQTGLCAESPVIDRVFNWLLKQGDSAWLERGFLTAVTEYLPPELPVSKYDHFAHRLRQMGALIDLLPGETTDWSLLVNRTGELLEKLAQAPRSSTKDAFPLEAVLLLCHALYRRIQPRGHELVEELVGEVGDPNYPTGFALALLDTAHDMPAITPDFTRAVQDHLLQYVGEQHDVLLQSILGQQTEGPVAQLAAMVQAAEQYRGGFVLDWVGRQASELCRSVDEHTLLRMLANLDRLSHLGEDRPWQPTIDGFRERGYLAALRQNIPLHGGTTVINPGALDEVLVKAVREYVEEQTADLRHDKEELQVQLAALEGRVQDLLAQQAERERLLAELRSGIRQGGDSTRFEERTRILRDLVTAVAEIERFAYRQGKPSPEADGIVRRLHSVIKGQRIALLDGPGTVVAFDPGQHQLADQITGSTPATVMVVERGYLIIDPQGSRRLLKPALVKAAPPAP